MSTSLKDMLKKHEGFRSRPYRCTAGKLTIGYGRNLDDVGISMEEAEYLLDHDIAKAEASLYAALPWTKDLDQDRKDVLINMTFNMGIATLLEFKNTLSLIQSGRYEEAAKNMMLSKWAMQVGSRAVELARIMEDGNELA